MNWLAKFFTSSIGQKAVVGASGLWLVLFLTIHVLGNCQLFIGAEQFNHYAHVMESNPFIIYVVRWVTMIAFLLHAFRGIALAYANRQARGAVGYKVTATNNSSFSARNMAWIGSWIFVFWGFHLYSFWWHLMKGDAPEKIVVMAGPGQEIVGDLKSGVATFVVPNPNPSQPSQTIKGKVEGEKFLVAVPSQDPQQPAHTEEVAIEERFADVYTMVAEAFKEPLVSIFYLLSMLVLAFHLWHGFASAFQTFGLTHKKYTPFITWVGRIYSIIVPVAFAAMPIYFWFFK
jgi:succinate dehydrogenase / fumarate reductase, cytochrome b subunit